MPAVEKYWRFGIMVMFQAKLFFFVGCFFFLKPSCVLDFLKALNQIVNALELTCIVKRCPPLLEYSQLLELELNFF